MNAALHDALDELLFHPISTKEADQRQAILLDMLWKMVRKDWHGVADCAMDLRELRL